MDIKQALEHPWIQKYNKSPMPELRKKSRENTKESNFKLYAAIDEVVKDN